MPVSRVLPVWLSFGQTDAFSTISLFFADGGFAAGPGGEFVMFPADHLLAAFADSASGSLSLSPLSAVSHTGTTPTWHTFHNRSLNTHVPHFRIHLAANLCLVSRSHTIAAATPMCGRGACCRAFQLLFLLRLWMKLETRQNRKRRFFSWTHARLRPSAN